MAQTRRPFIITEHELQMTH
uniref:Uncharacterized protein n=1 Tax=Anguilla anguilla TaxID=7936 RepID=A0A0E9T3X7_ANGAN